MTLNDKSNKDLADDLLAHAHDLSPGIAKGILREVAARLTGLAEEDGLPFKVGDAVLFRTVTMIVIGRVRTITKDFVVVDEGGWVAETARFSETLKFGKLNEFEKAPDWILISRGAWVDVYPWPNGIELPTETK